MPYGGFGAAPPGKRTRSRTGWLIAIVVAAAAAIGLFALVLLSVLGPRDEESYQAGREAGLSGDTFVKFGGSTPEEYCENQFSLHTPFNQNSDIRRRDFMAGCLDAVEEELKR